MRSDDTTDSILSGRIRIRQPRKGYRFGIDSVLLAHFIKLNAEERALEIGCGTGVVIILLARLQKFKQIVGVEIQKEPAEYAAWNLEQNGVPDCRIVQADAKLLDRILPLNSFDLIFSNPPYRKLGSGKLNPSAEKAVARHEVSLRLQDLFQCCEQLLKPTGRLTVIMPNFRLQDFEKLISKHKYFPAEQRFVHSFSDEPPVFFLATVSKTTLSFVEYPKLVIYERPGEYTSEVEGMLGPI